MIIINNSCQGRFIKKRPQLFGKEKGKMVHYNFVWHEENERCSLELKPITNLGPSVLRPHTHRSFIVPIIIEEKQHFKNCGNTWLGQDRGQP